MTLGRTYEMWSQHILNTVVDALMSAAHRWSIDLFADNLKPSSTVEFRVVAVNRHGAGKPSLSSNNLTMPQQPPAAAPRNVAARFALCSADNASDNKMR